MSFKFDGEKLAKKFKEFVEDKSELDKVGSIIVKEIRADARDGIGYDGKDFPSISSKTIQRRSRLASVNATNRFYSAAKSNATFLGDTINKIVYKVSKGKLELFGKGKHKGVKGIRVKQIKGSNAPISDILKGLKSLGYEILGVSDKAKKRISIQFTRWIRRNL